jgi:hypothetical protein
MLTEDDLLDDDDRQQRARIAPPNAANSMPALSLRGLPAPAALGSTSDLESRGVASHIAPAPIAKPSALETRTARDQAELNRKESTGSGISQIKNPLARGTLRGLETIGSIIAPRTTSMIPGTELHHDRLVAQDRSKIGEDELDAQREATIAKTGAETEETQSRAHSLDAASAAAGQPKAKEESWTPFPGFTDADGTPLLHEANSGQVVRASDKQPPTGFKASAPKIDKGQPAHITYDAGIPVTVVSPDGKVYDVNDPKLPPELKPLVDAANRAHGTHITEETNKEARAAEAADRRAQHSADARSEAAAGKRYDTALDSEQRLSRMESAYQKGLKGDQQAMLSLLTDHIGMTLGMQKGARITKDILQEAQQSQPWLAKVLAKFDDRGFLSGVTLGPEQMKQMLELGYGARDRAVQGAFEASELYGVQPPKGANNIFGKRKIGEMPALQQGGGEGGGDAGKPAGATMKVPGSDGKLHWSDGKKDLGVVQ